MYKAAQFVIVFLAAQVSICLPKEHVDHGAYSPDLQKEHDIEHGHAAVSGSAKSDREWHKLTPDEAKSRLRNLVTSGIDVDKDGFVSSDELKTWIYQNFKDANLESVRERFLDADVDGDDKVSWAEHLEEAWGLNDEEDQSLMHPRDYADDRLLIKEDKVLFDAADADHDGSLTFEEYFKFSHPEEHSDMHPVITQKALKSRDRNGDGKISWEEYIYDIVPLSNRNKEQEELYQTEKSHFDEVYDTDHDGFLSGHEIYKWLVPDDAGSAEFETKHLINVSDTNKDGRLSIEEILDNYKEFVGSSVTQQGDMLDDDDDSQHASDEL